MALLTIPQRYLSQPQHHVEIAPEYADAELLALFNTAEWRDISLKGHGFSSSVPPTEVISRHGRSQRFGDFLGTHLKSSGNIPALPRFTAFAWVRPGTMGTGYKRILETNYSVNFYLGSSNTANQYNFIVRGSSLTACVGGQQVVGQRDFVAGVYNGTHCILYVNGREVARTTASAPSTARVLCIGANEGNPNSGEHWVGEIDTVGVLPKALGPEQILSLCQDPYQLVRPVLRRIWFTPSAPSTDHNLAISGAVQTNSAQAAGITQTHPLAVQSAAQANAPASGAITLVHPLTASPASQTNTVQTGGISQGSAFNVASATQGNTAGTGGITQSHVLTGGAAVQGNTAGTGAVALVHELATDNPIQQNSASVAGLAPSSDINLSVPALAQANLADDVPVHQVHTLVTSASVQTSTTSAVSLTQVHTLTSEQLAQGNVASTIAVNVSGQLVALGLTQNNAFSAKQISMVQTLTIADFAQDNRMSGGAISPGAIFEQAVAAGTAIEQRIKKPGIPANTPAWLRTMLEIVTGRRNNKITIPESKALNFSAIPTKEECEALYQYTHSVRNATEEIIKRLDS